MYPAHRLHYSAHWKERERAFYHTVLQQIFEARRSGNQVPETLDSSIWYSFLPDNLTEDQEKEVWLEFLQEYYQFTKRWIEGRETAVIDYAKRHDPDILAAIDYLQQSRENQLTTNKD